MKIKNTRESLDLNIKRDSTTYLPLYSERHKILKLINTYLPLPYSIVEYGCGKKCSIILNRLIKLGIPAYGIRRGMIMENDMSQEQLDQTDFTRRKEPLTIKNLLFYRIDFKDETLLNMLNNEYVSVDHEHAIIHAGDYELHNEKRVQFIKARSHIVPLITFWDDSNEQPIELVLDPTVDPDKLFKVEKLRNALQAPQAHIFTAHILARFEFDEKFLTKVQQKKIEHIIGDQKLRDLSTGASFDLIRKMNNAPEKSIGDPETWTYANNLHSDDDDHHNLQLQYTGLGEHIRDYYEQMLEARKKNHLEEVLKLRSKLEEEQFKTSVLQTIRNDAYWSEKKLTPLAILANTISYHRALKHLYHWTEEENNLFKILTDNEEIEKFHGLGVLLRERIESLAQISRNKEDEIDARAFTPLFFDACLLTMKQMQKAGMSVFIDKVGNIHGLLINDETRNKLEKNEIGLKDVIQNAICHCSHIDTVKDAGKYDGRLGVLSGIICAQALFDLKNCFGQDMAYTHPDRPLLVTAFVGEEMTFTGNDVAMPGSSAVSGQASLKQIHGMTNANGERLKDKLQEFLTFIKDAADRKEISIFNDFSERADIDHCIEPTDFLTRHTYERHIEQGPVLDRHVLPLVKVDTIMGIHQEDFMLSGKNSEAAALALNQAIRKCYTDDGTEDIRATVGIITSDDQDRNTIPVNFGMRWKLLGQKNHAGATLLVDRKDPGIAASRLAEYFVELVNELNKEKDINFEPVIGAIELIPGANRNVIPAEANITLGISSSSEISQNITLKVEQDLKSFIINNLSLSVTDGGEGVQFCNVNLVDFLNKPEKVRLSLDLRGKDLKKIGQFQEKIDNLLPEIESKYEVKINSSVEQNLQPYPLAKTGQVLQLERSFGGSHNPNEAELATDLLRGTLLQLGITMEIMKIKDIRDLNLFAFTESKMPEEWRDKVKFTSGALHDTCNIAAAFVKENKKDTVNK